MENSLSLSFASSSTLQPFSPTSFPPRFSGISRDFGQVRINRSKSAGRHPNSLIHLVGRASGTGENEFPIKRTKKIFTEEAIGAEYGEGFESFSPDAPLKIDVDFLNDRLQEGFLNRIRYAMKPDEAYGLIFSWDNVVADADWYS